MLQGHTKRMHYEDDLRSCRGTLTQGRPARPGYCKRMHYKELLRDCCTILRYKETLPDRSTRMIEACHVQTARGAMAHRLQSGKALPVDRIQASDSAPDAGNHSSSF